MANYPLGNDFQVWRNTGTVGSPTWSKVTCIAADSLGLRVGRDNIEMPCKGDDIVRGKLGKKRVSLTLGLRYSDDDTNAVALRDAAINGTKVNLRITQQDASEDPETSVGHGYIVDEFYLSADETSMADEDGAVTPMTGTPAIDVDASLASVVGTWQTS